MREFAELVDSLYYLNSNNAKAELLLEYLRNTPDPHRGWAIAAIAGTLSFEFFKRRTIKELITERVDPVLFDLSYDYVGEMSETVAHLWSTTDAAQKPSAANSKTILPTLDKLVEQFTTLPKKSIKPYLTNLLDSMTPTQRWALLKLGTRGLRIGMSARFLKKILAQYAQQHMQQTDIISVEDIERVWHGVSPPYLELFAWLEGKAGKPDTSNKLTFQPVMLAHPITHDTLHELDLKHWQAEWKFDGIRAQLVSSSAGVALFSRTGDDISHSFPDFIAQLENLNISGRFDGELVAISATNLPDKTNKIEIPYQNIASFNQLQQRLNKKKPSKALMQDIPVALIIYDALQIESKDMRHIPLTIRSDEICRYIQTNNTHPHLWPSERLAFNTSTDLINLKQQASEMSNGYIEGIMIKRKDAPYVSGRPKGQWYKLKRDPKLVDAVIMYAQRGHGKRSSFYSDFTFGCWQDDILLPIGKAYSGFTDDELKKLDAWVRKNTIGRFGPVKEVKKALVFEVAFDAVAPSNRHKSKVALRFPRIHRIRWDKPAEEADQLTTLVEMIK